MSKKEEEFAHHSCHKAMPDGEAELYWKLRRCCGRSKKEKKSTAKPPLWDSLEAKNCQRRGGGSRALALARDSMGLTIGKRCK